MANKFHHFKPFFFFFWLFWHIWRHSTSHDNFVGVWRPTSIFLKGIFVQERLLQWNTFWPGAQRGWEEVSEGGCGPSGVGNFVFLKQESYVPVQFGDTKRVTLVYLYHVNRCGHHKKLSIAKLDFVQVCGLSLNFYKNTLRKFYKFSDSRKTWSWTSPTLQSADWPISRQYHRPQVLKRVSYPEVYKYIQNPWWYLYRRNSEKAMRKTNKQTNKKQNKTKQTKTKQTKHPIAQLRPDRPKQNLRFGRIFFVNSLPKII